MDITRQQIRDARHPACRWTQDDIDAAIEARFPATDPIDFAALCTAWADDRALGISTLQQCVMLATSLCGTRPRGSLFRSRDALRDLAVAFPAAPPPP